MNPKRKCILLLLDGLGDRAYPELGNLTPLAAAKTPNMDEIAANGANGLYHPAKAGQALPSENAHFSMLGYEPDEFPGRGFLEALGADIDISPEDVCFLAHFAELSEKDGILFLRNGLVGGAESETETLVNIAGNFIDDVSIRFFRTHALFGVLVFTGAVSPFVTDSDPITAGMPLQRVRPWKTHEKDPDALRTAGVLNRHLSELYRRLSVHPMNRIREKRGNSIITGMVTQRAGRFKSVPSFRERYGLKGLCIASGIVYKGLFRFLGMDFHLDRDTDDPGADIARRLVTARDLCGRYDFIHVHTKAPDEAAHRKDPILKKRVIESLDAGIGRVMGSIFKDPEISLVMTADHSTPSSGNLIHSGEPVPLCFHGPGVRRDRVSKFDEIQAATGSIGFVRKNELIYMILNQLDMVKMQGLMDTPEDRAFRSGETESFCLV